MTVFHGDQYTAALIVPEVVVRSGSVDAIHGNDLSEVLEPVPQSLSELRGTRLAFLQCIRDGGRNQLPGVEHHSAKRGHGSLPEGGLVFLRILDAESL